MKPGDHPDFFRFPAPPGRSRESSIALDKNGRFSHDGQPVAHPGMARAFASWIARHPDDRRYVLSNGYDWTYFTVELVPYFVENVRLVGDQLIAQLFDGSEEPLDLSRLALDEDDVLYTWVKGGEFEARFTRHAQLALAPHLANGPNDEVELEISGRRYRPGRRNTPRD